MRFKELYESDGRGGSELKAREPWPVTMEEFTAKLAEKRYQAENGGLRTDLGNGVIATFPTTRDARGSFFFKLMSAESVGPSYEEHFVLPTPTGERVVVVMTLEGLRNLRDAIDSHVAQCYHMEVEYLGLAQGGGILLDELYEQIQSGWPGSEQG